MSLLKSIKNSISNNLNWVSGDIAIDLGTANTLIWLSGKGIIINEPSIIARNSKTQALLAVGDDAKLMQGKTHEGIEIIRPLRDGVISDFTAVDEMLQGFIRKVNLNRITRPRMVICVPSGCTEVERRAVRDSGEKQAAREVFLVDEPVAAAIGIELDISKPIGNVIVDIGGGTTEVAVISLNGVVTKKAIKVAGDVMDHDIQNWFRNNHRLEIGAQTAEQIKISVGSAMRSRSKNILVKGRDLVSGIPKTIDIRSDEIRQALKDSVKRILEVVKDALESTPPELSSDIIDRGILVAGGGAQLRGLDQVIREKTNVPCNVVEEPHLAIVKGCGKIIEDLEKYKHVLI